MSKLTEVFKNTSWLLISQIITSMFGFVWIVLLARYLGVSDFGTLTFAISFSSIMGIFMDLGISTYTTRDLARDPSLSQKYIGNNIPLKIVLSIASFLVTLLILIAMGYETLTIEVTLLLAIQTIFINMGYLFNGVFQSFSKMKYQAIGIIINAFALLLGVIATIFLNLGILGAATSYLIASILTLIYLYRKIRTKIVIPNFQWDFNFWKNSVKSAIPFGLTNIFASIYFLVDSVMLAIMVGSVAVGIYSSAYKIITVFLTIYTVYNYVIFPLMSRFHKDSEDLLKITYEKSVKYLLIAMLPIAVGITFYSQDIIVLIYGSDYVLAANVLKILIWNVVFLMVNGASSLLLNSSHNEVSVTKINGMATFFNIGLNVILIYYLSYIGASISTVLTGVLICILMSYIILKRYKLDKSLLKDIIKIFISTFILAVVLYLANLSFIIAIPVSIFVYLIAILITKTLDSTDKSVLKEIIGK